MVTRKVQTGTAAGEWDRLNPARRRRISIIGATGSGKTVLARRLSNEWVLPLYELDRFFRDDDGRELPKARFVGAISTVTKLDAWILDGHYRAVRELIWQRAEIVIWLDYPLWLIALRLLKRFLNKRGSAQIHRLKTGNDEGHSDDHVPTSASWGERLGRLARTVRERREYGHLLRSPAYRHLELVELRSVAATEEFIRKYSAVRAANSD